NIMKKLLILFFIIITANLLFAQNDNIFVEVHEDTATIFHNNTERNCGSLFVMDVEFDEYQITVTEVDTGDYAYCMCYFDLSVTIANLTPGTYNVDIFGTDSLYGTYWGNTQFTIGEVQLVNHSYSDCKEETVDSDLELLVNGNYLTLNWSTPELNCGLEPLWFGFVQNDTFFVTMNDIGWPADCLCLFDLTATFGPFAPGNYTLNFWQGVYGYPTFTIQEKNTKDDPEIIAQSQSNCSGITYTEQHTSLPLKFKLYQNSPNPFNPETAISYELFKPCNVTLSIYNLEGKLIQTLIRSYQTPDSYKTTWNGKNGNGEFSPSGIYFYRLQAGRTIQQKKMLLLK
ncbi:MAG: T9SS type A sorting domain-containing protein, partial [Calditrichia bacterium]|nr:T9SS type A sorting domain-containing protein [Calditrichia bacterium]